MVSNSTGTVLVTGASGYVASHTIKLLLEKGVKVRGTVRSLKNKEKYSFFILISKRKERLINISRSRFVRRKQLVISL